MLDSFCELGDSLTNGVVVVAKTFVERKKDERRQSDRNNDRNEAIAVVDDDSGFG